MRVGYYEETVRSDSHLASEIDIGRFKSVEERFKETKDYLDNLLNYANAPIIVWDPSFRITRFNRAFERLTGLSAADVIGKPLDILFPAGSRDESMSYIRRTVKGERWDAVEIPILRLGGAVRTVLWNSATLYTADGKSVLATIAQGQDITERKQAEEKLRETRDYLENLLNYANAPIIVWDPSFRITRFNRAFERLTGLSAADVIGKLLDILFPAGSREESMSYIRRTVKGERWDAVEIPILRLDGAVRTVLWNSATLYTSDGETVLATIAQGQDITERKHLEEELIKHRNNLEMLVDKRTRELKAINEQLLKEIAERKKVQQALEESEEQYRQMIETANEGIWIVDDNDEITFVNQKAAEMLGYKTDEMMGQYILNFVDNEWYERGISSLKLRKEGLAEQFELKFIRSDGKPLWAIVSTNPLIDRNGCYKGALSMLTDITIRRKREEQIVFQASLLEQVRNAVIASDSKGRIVFWNRYAQILYQWEGKEVVGKRIDRVIQTETGCDNNRDKSYLHAIKLSKSEYFTRRKDGSVFIANIEDAEIYDMEGTPIGHVWVIIDITERKRIEHEISRLDRLNLIGEIAASIGHEIRNPMTTVRGFLQMLEEKNECLRFKDYFSLMIEELDRANVIISEFLSLAKDKSVDLKKRSLNTIVETIFPLIQADAMIADKYIMLEMGSIPEIPLDEKEIRQLVLNLVRNGLEAIDSGGQVIISTYTDNDEVVLSVRDEGIGIPPEILKRLGTPFVTTKENGTGLGLAICYSIASRHNARIGVESSPSGTSFRVMFKQHHCC